QALDAHPVVLGQVLVLAALAVALPYLRGRGPWFAAAGGVALLAAAGLGAPSAGFLPLAAAAWATAAFILVAGVAVAADTRAESGPTRKRLSRFRSREIVPTFSPE